LRTQTHVKRLRKKKRGDLQKKKEASRMECVDYPFASIGKAARKKKEGKNEEGKKKKKEKGGTWPGVPPISSELATPTSGQERKKKIWKEGRRGRRGGEDPLSDVLFSPP